MLPVTGPCLVRLHQIGVGQRLADAVKTAHQNLRVSRCRNNQACDPRVLHCLV
jgi:hypothetical protein